MPEVMAVINQLMGNAVQSLEQLLKEQEAITLKIELGTATIEDYQRLIELANKIEGITSTKELDKFNESLKNTFSGIDFESPEKITQAFASVEQSAKTAKDSVNDVADELIRQMEILRKAATTEEELNIANLYIKSAEINRANNLAKIDTVITGFFDDVQTGMILKINEVTEKTQKDWENMWFGEKVLHSNRIGLFLTNVLNTHKKNYLEPISNNINSSLKELGTKGEAWMLDAFTTITSAAFGNDFTMASSKYKSQKFLDDMGLLINNTLNGIEKNTLPTAQKTGQNIGNAIVDGVSKALKNIEAFQINLTTPSGLAMSSTLFGSKLLSLKTPGTYASGGFPEDGLFFANSNELVGQFGNGRTAVANNEQITTGIYRAVKSAFTESGGSGGDWHIQIVNGDGQVTGSAIITAAERKNRRDGKTIIPLRA